MWIRRGRKKRREPAFETRSYYRWDLRFSARPADRGASGSGRRDEVTEEDEERKRWREKEGEGRDGGGGHPFMAISKCCSFDAIDDKEPAD